MNVFHYSFPSIEQFRNVVHEINLRSTYTGKDETGEPIYDDSLPRPVINFKGTIKLHGTNASIVFFKDGSMQYQSRERIITIYDDLNGFVNKMNPVKDKLKNLVAHIPFNDHLVLYGEWCGKGIHKGCGIHQLEKMFVIFGCKLDGKWVNIGLEIPEERIFYIQSFSTYYIDIDFNNPGQSIDRLNELTAMVEAECPVAKHFGISGIGEGIVWVGVNSNDTGGDGENKTYRFKIKGEKHSMKEKKEVNLIDADVYSDVKEFVYNNLSKNRLEQGLSVMKENKIPFAIESIGQFLKWCSQDILKECQLEIAENNLDQKMVSKEVQKQAKEFFIKALDESSGLIRKQEEIENDGVAVVPAVFPV